MSGDLAGGCVCGALRYNLKSGFRMKPYACHCTDCQTRTGSAFSMHMLVMLSDIELEGSCNKGTYEQPSGAIATIVGCPSCMTRIYATNSTRPGMAGLRVGTLDDSKDMTPTAHLWVQSKQPWLDLPNNTPSLAAAPESSEEWLKLLGPD